MQLQVVLLLLVTLLLGSPQQVSEWGSELFITHDTPTLKPIWQRHMAVANTHATACFVSPQVLGVGSSKVACDYSNRLCQWNATYAFGATVLGDLVGWLSGGVEGWLLPASVSLMYAHTSSELCTTALAAVTCRLSSCVVISSGGVAWLAD